MICLYDYCLTDISFVFEVVFEAVFVVVQWCLTYINYWAPILFAYFVFSYRVLINDQNKYSKNIYDEVSKINELVTDFYYRYHSPKLDEKGMYELISIRAKVASRLTMLGTAAQRYPFYNPFFYMFGRLIKSVFGQDSRLHKLICRMNLNLNLDRKILIYQATITDDTPLEFFDGFPDDFSNFKDYKEGLKKFYDDRYIADFFDSRTVDYLSRVFDAGKDIVEFLEDRDIKG